MRKSEVGMRKSEKKEDGKMRRWEGEKVGIKEKSAVGMRKSEKKEDGKMRRWENEKMRRLSGRNSELVRFWISDYINR